VRWFDADIAFKRLTRPDDRQPLDELVEAYARERLDTRALVVVRHGTARRRADWNGTELDRPLTPEGLRQAKALIPIMSTFGVGRVVTSAWARCVSTIAPYAAAAQVMPEVSSILTEDQHNSSPARVAAEVLRLLEAHGDVALCTHRPVLPTVVDVLAPDLAAQIDAAMPVAALDGAISRADGAEHAQHGRRSADHGRLYRGEPRGRDDDIGARRFGLFRGDRCGGFTCE